MGLLFDAMPVAYPFLKQVRIYGLHFQQSVDQAGLAANPARGQLKRGNELFPVPVRA